MLRILFSLILFICALSSYAMQMDHDDEALYKKAIRLRDKKENEESRREAENIFKSLAHQGHRKAMHNYALILYEKNDFQLAYHWFVLVSTGEEKLAIPEAKRNAQRLLLQKRAKPELYLVVNSNRPVVMRQGPLVDAIFDESKVDLSHIKTFDTKATTMHQLLNVMEGRHIIGDASIYDFSEYIILSAFIERFPTTKTTNKFLKKADEQLLNDQENYLGQTITNIAKHMPSKAFIEVEWLPFTGLYKYDLPRLEKALANNPFHCFFNADVLLQSIFLLAGDNNLDKIEDSLKEATIQMKDRVHTLLKFYYEKGVGNSVQELISMAYWEARVVLQMCSTMSPHIFLAYRASDQNFEALAKAFNDAFIGTVMPCAAGAGCSFNRSERKEKEGFFYEVSQFLGNTFLNTMIQDLAAEYNSLQVKAYLESLELFDDIRMEKGENRHNKRKNVWIISMTKR